MSDRSHSCPLCPFTDESRDGVYDHLLTSHRKHSISTALLEAHSSRSKPP